MSKWEKKARLFQLQGGTWAICRAAAENPSSDEGDILVIRNDLSGKKS